MTKVNCSQSAYSYSYDGLGGQKEEFYSSAFVRGSKRSASKTTSQKFRKLAPTSKKMKISDYLNPPKV